MVRVEGGSRIEVYSHSLIIHNYITSVILPVPPWRSVPTSTCRHINVTRVPVSNHASAWELVVYERGEGPEITTESQTEIEDTCAFQTSVPPGNPSSTGEIDTDTYPLHWNKNLFENRKP